jgi:hypothetical protein
MGIDRTIHLGAFIKIPIQYKEDIETVRTCGKHENHSDDNFCPICGDKIKEIKQPLEIEMDIYDIIGNSNFINYNEENVMYLFSNLYNCEIETEYNVFTTLTSKLIQEKINFFEKKHINDINLLKTKLNIDIKVEFGFVYYIE